MAKKPNDTHCFLFCVVRSYFTMEFTLDSEKYQQDKVVVSQLIDQTEVDLVGGIWTDKDGKIHYVGLTVTERGHIMPDFPQMKDVYIADVAQVGLRR